MGPKVLFFPFFLVLAGSRGFAAPSPAVTSFLEAKNQESKSSEKSCKIYQTLSQDKNFPLADVAYLRQKILCSAPLTNMELENLITTRPWLGLMAAEANEKLALQEKSLLKYTFARIEIAKSQKGQVKTLALLNEGEKKLKDAFARDDKDMQKGLGLFADARSAAAPRLIEKPTPEQELKVANDFLQARDFAKSRAGAEKILQQKTRTLEDQLAARKIIRSSWKVEGNKTNFLSQFKKDWEWVLTKKKNREAIEIGMGYVRALWTEDRGEESRKILKQIEAQFSKTDHLAEIHFIRGKMYEEKRDFAQALESYEIPELNLTLALDKKIQFAKAWNAIKVKDDAKAIRHLEPLILLHQEDPFESARALYWKARVLRRGGQADESKKVFLDLQNQDPLGFYGVLAFAETATPFPPLQRKTLPSQIQNSPFYDSNYVQALVDTNENEILLSLIKDPLKKISPKDAPAVWLPVFLASARAGSYLPLFAQISTLSSENRAQLLKDEPELLFPMDFQDIIESSAKKAGIPVELALSIIRQESAFNPYARSPADAFGLMQILPTVGNHYEKQTGFHVDHFEDLYRPEINVSAGSFLLKDLLRKYEGKVFLTAAAYNASERALSGWVKSRWNNDPIEFIEEIPYEETRSYVKLILRNCVFYSRLLNSGQATPFPKTCLGNDQFPKL